MKREKLLEDEANNVVRNQDNEGILDRKKKITEVEVEEGEKMVLVRGVENILEEKGEKKQRKK